MKKNIPLILIFLFLCITTNSQNHKSNEKKIFIEDLLSRMTLDEKIGQLTQVVGKDKVNRNLLRQGKIGSYLIGIDGADTANAIQKIAIEETRLGIPLIFANDVIHGYHTIFPIPLAEASSWNPTLIEKASQIAAIEAASEGTHWTFAPMVDIARDPRWGRIMEGSGEDPYLGSVLGNARVKGYQGKSLLNNGSIAACAKHYVAYGAAEAGKDYNSVDISERTLRNIFLPPFKAAVDAGVETMMSSFNDLNGSPASANHFTLTKILREEWGFDGFVVSDYNSVGELVAHGIAADKKEAALRGFMAGVDMDMLGDTVIGKVYMDNLTQLVKEGLVPIEKIDASVKEILELKYNLGLFANPYVDKDWFENNLPLKIERDNIAKSLASESAVLLKNANKILPLAKDISSIALIGPLADNQADLLGNWACDGRPENVITLLEGIKQKLDKNTELKYVKGCEIIDKSPNDIEAAVETAKNADVAILAVGEGKGESGEAASKTNLNISDIQMELIKRVHATKTPIVLVLFNGRPLTIPWINENIDAIVEGWYLGDQTGNAIADILFGDTNPSGKLPITFPRSVGQIPIYYSHKNTGRPTSDYKYTTKYIDEEVTPLFPFGFGLSYTNYEYSNLNIIQDNTIKSNLRISVDIQNTGDRAGMEIVQLYIRDVVASITRPTKELKGFDKTHLLPGEKKTIQFDLNKDDFMFLNIDLKNILEPGIFEIMVGKNSQELLKKEIYIN